MFLQVEYGIQFPEKLIRYNFYCADKKIFTRLEADADPMVGTFEWASNPKNTFELSTKQIEYLQIADRIRSIGNDRDARQSIIITSTFIKLNQSNHMNSRSLDHKDSYVLRDLYIIIPLKERNKKEDPKVVGSNYIGDMEIILNDRSAESQRTTGDKIRIAIENEIIKYKQDLDNKK
ncbi:hypothetical protein [Flavivirga eckloniae]|nr:hypothetical protein [Flavivirga eckloniae]